MVNFGPPKYEPSTKTDMLIPKSARSTRKENSPNYKNQDSIIIHQTGSYHTKKKLKKRKIIIPIILTLVIILIAYPTFLIINANNSISRIEVIDKNEGLNYDSFLIIGNDSRDTTKVALDSNNREKRSDSILLLVKPNNGKSALISIPRDTYVNIDNIGDNKINASLSLGNEKLLKNTVEEVTGIKVQHFLEIGFEGLKTMVDTVGKIKLCYNYNIDDEKSGLKWKKGCHNVNGKTTLAFARMRYSDPLSDIGRVERQRQVISSLSKTMNTMQNYINPAFHLAMIDALKKSVVIDKNDDIFSLLNMYYGFKDATSKDGIQGTLPIDNMGINTNVGSAVQINEEKTKEYFANIIDGTMPSGKIGGINYK